MDMDVLVSVTTGYLALGAVSLLVFDQRTGRIRAKLHTAAGDMQNRLAVQGQAVGGRSAVVLLLLAIWVFWPAVFVGALSRRRDNGQKE